MHTSLWLLALSSLSLLACSSKSDAPADDGSGQTGDVGGSAGGGGSGGGGGAGGGTAGTGVSDSGASDRSVPGEAAAPKVLWDWSGIVGTGQSLSVGATTVAVTKTQPFHNLKLSLGSAVVGAPPYNADNPALSMVPLVEPIRTPGTAYPTAYPKNIAGETPHSAMANQLTALYQADTGGDFVSVHSVVGESGQLMSVIDKTATAVDNADGTSQGHAYKATLFEAAAIARLAKAAGKTYGVGAIVLTHGESDCCGSGYEDAMFQMYQDYNADIPPLTGQTSKIILMTSQQHTVPGNTASDLDTVAASTLDEWMVGVHHPGEIICTGPKYQYPYTASDHVHLTAAGYDRLGEKCAEVYYEKVVLGHDWQPLQPLSLTSATRSGTTVTVKFHVPVPPLAWDDKLPAPHQTAHVEWKNGKGFEVEDYVGNAITINSVEIQGDSVLITCAADPGAGGSVRYAWKQDGVGSQGGTALGRTGQLCDSDPFVGYGTKQAQPNYAVAFELDLK